MPGVFTLTEMICPKLLAEALPMNEKHPVPVDMRNFLQTIVARLHIPEETSYVGLSLSLVQIVLQLACIAFEIVFALLRVLAAKSPFSRLYPRLRSRSSKTFPPLANDPAGHAGYPLS